MQLRITSRKKFTVLLCALGLISIVAIYPRQTVNFFYSTAIQIKDYIHFYGYRPVKSFAIRIPASYTIHGIDVSRWQERINWQRVAKCAITVFAYNLPLLRRRKAKSWWTPIFRVTGN